MTIDLNAVGSFLSGKKSYLAAIAGLVATALVRYGYINATDYYDTAMTVGFLLAIFLRMAISKAGIPAEIPAVTKEDIPAPTPNLDLQSVAVEALKQMLQEKGQANDQIQKG